MEIIVFTPEKNPTNTRIAEIIASSKHKAARKITDTGTGNSWFWPAEQATHAEGAKILGVEYDRPPGAGDIVTND